MLRWTPTATQNGPQGFCAGAVDNSNVQSDQWCITFLVGIKSPDIIRPTAVQGSASPLGTILQNHLIFSIQSKRAFTFPSTSVCILANLRVDRPSRNGTFVHFKDATTNTIVQSYDCGWSPYVTYTGFTIVFRFPVAPWIPGHNYYVMFDSGMFSSIEYSSFSRIDRFSSFILGVASGTEFCGKIKK